jgi:putative PIN family toxin of toxin-antitoxin system
MTWFIIDTNVVVSGLITGNAASPPARILDAMLTDQARCVVSEELVSEYRAVLLRPAIARRHGLSEVEIDTILARLALSCAVRTPSGAAAGAPDPGDTHLWALLEAEPQAVLVTGDRRLLDSAPRGRRVITPAQMLEKLAAD